MERALKIIQLGTIYILCMAYLHLHIYYKCFAIDINQWMGLEEILILFTSDLVSFSLFFCIAIYGAHFILRIQEKLEYDFPSKKNDSKRKRRITKTVMFLFLLLLLSGLFYALVYHFPKTESQKAIDTITAIIFTIALAAFIWQKEIIGELLNKVLSKTNVFMILFAITLLAYSSVGAMLKVNEKIKSKEYACVTNRSDNSIDSLIYLGSTSKYYFLYAPKAKPNETLIFEKNTIKSIVIKGDSLAFRIYN